MEASEPLLQDAAALIFSAWREDGRFKLSPQGAIYPCHTVHAADTLCRLGIRRRRAAANNLRASFGQPAEGRRLALQQVQFRPGAGNGVFQSFAHADGPGCLPL